MEHKDYTIIPYANQYRDDMIFKELSPIDITTMPLHQYGRHSINEEFWSILDDFVQQSELIIDRPKGSAHPNFPHMIHPVDYGYLKHTTSMDGDGIDVWVGTVPEQRVDAIMCVVDAMKRDSEIKILIGCTQQEKAMIYEFHNHSQYMKGILIRRKV